MKKQLPNWLKIVYIIVFLAIAGYTYWQQYQEQQANGDNQAAVAGEADDETWALKNGPPADRAHQVNANQPTGSPSSNTAAASSSRPTTNPATTNKPATAAKTTNKGGNSAAEKNAAAEFGVQSFRWAKVQRDDFTSPQGLVYTMGPNREHRLEHVFRHAEDQPDRPGRHGVFDGNPDEILQTLDNAYKLVKFRSNEVQTETDGNRKVHLIHMKKRIGYVGGQTGKRQNHPVAKKIRLVLEGARVVTAFPLLLLR